MAWPNIVGLAAAHATYAEDDFIEFSLEKINQGREILNSTFKMHDIKPLLLKQISFLLILEDQ